MAKRLHLIKAVAQLHPAAFIEFTRAAWHARHEPTCMPGGARELDKGGWMQLRDCLDFPRPAGKL